MNKDIIKKAESYVNILLMPLENHYFHQFDHALEVKKRSIELAEKEWLEKWQIEILAIAWLFHDTGFIIQYDKNEYIWAKIAKNYLKTIFYPEDRIEIVERLILATDPTYREPKDIMEEIIKDADLDNLWRDDFWKRWNDLKKEIELIKSIKLKDPEWKHASLEFIENHRYFTKSQKEERWEKKLENVRKLAEIVNKI